MTTTEPNIGGLGLEVGFQLHAGIKSVAAEVREMRRDMLRRQRLEVPRDRRENFSNITGVNNQYPASGNLVLVLDGPQIGVLWEVKSLQVGGAAATLSPAGTAYIFRCTTPPTDLNMAELAPGVAISQTPFPVGATWGTGVFKVRPQANLYVVITGGTPGATYTAYADINEYPDTPLMATVGVE